MRLGFILDATWIHHGCDLDLSWMRLGFILDATWIVLTFEPSLTKICAIFSSKFIPFYLGFELRGLTVNKDLMSYMENKTKGKKNLKIQINGEKILRTRER